MSESYQPAEENQFPKKIVFGSRCSGKTWMMANMLAAAANVKGGIDYFDVQSGVTYHVPPGTPPREALPVRIKE